MGPGALANDGNIVGITAVFGDFGIDPTHRDVEVLHHVRRGALREIAVVDRDDEDAALREAAREERPPRLRKEGLITG